MKHTVVKLILNVLFICLGSTSLLSQIKTEEYPQSAIEPDSLFMEFEYPVLPNYIVKDARKYLYRQKEDISISQINIVIFFIVDNKGEVRKLSINPLFNVGNDIPKDDIFWDDMEISIRKSLKKWRFKILYFPDGYHSENPYINTSPPYRPYNGSQSHIMILNYNADIHIPGLASFLYWMQPP